MSVQEVAPSDDTTDLSGPDAVAVATAYIASAALEASPGGRVGLELEFHLVDLAQPVRRPGWDEITGLVGLLPKMPCASSVTFEPGGQIELSTPPYTDVVSSIDALRRDEETLRSALATAGYGAAPLGSDPARTVQRINPKSRYAAMERHFEARDCAGSGKAMMSATAALQINLDAGPAEGWSARLAHVRSLVPMLVAASAGSPYLAGHASGWHSMRQETWHGIDRWRSDPIPAGEPTVAWALYTLSAPVMLLHEPHGDVAVTERVAFADWLRDPSRLGRCATIADLDYHLTTLFPPVRPRGYLEIRCVDSLPDRWWPALAALTATLIDDPQAADEAAELCAPVAHAWETAARSGIADPLLRSAVVGCAEIAARRGPAALGSDLEDFAELVASGRTPSDELRAVAEKRGPLRLLEEESHA